MPDRPTATPDSTAIRVALWRALHLAIDPPPHVLTDDVGIALAAPDAGWRDRPDMHPLFTRPFRASIVARARFIEDLVAEEAKQGIGQYVLLGAGLDSFVQRRPEIARQLTVFEVDQPAPQAWKRERLLALDYGIPSGLQLVPVDFEAGHSWWDELKKAGFATDRPAVVASTGVSLYLTREANMATLRQVAALAPGSTFAMTFILPVEMAEPDERIGIEAAIKGAKASGTPFVSFFMPSEIIAMALEAGFKDANYVSGGDLAQRYFVGRSDGLRPGSAEGLLVATT